MSFWLLRRLGQMLIVILGVVTLAFLLSYVVPGDPARLVAGPNASPQAVASIRNQLGLDRSEWSQYVSYLGRLVHGNLGTSFALQNQSVGGFYEFDNLADSQRFAQDYFPTEAKKLGASFTTRVFDGAVTEEASREMRSVHYA